jgi:diguanylate cyclase (GGDEF)-like protein
MIRGQALWHDRAFRLALLAVLALASPFLLPGLPRSTVAYYSTYISNIFLILIVVAALEHHRERIPSERERRFWRMWTVALLFWGGQALVMWAGAGLLAASLTLLQDALLAGFYVCLVLALRLRPDRGGGPHRRDALRSLETAGTLVFAVGLFVYFTLIPLLLDPSLLATDAPSLILYVLLDGVLVLHVLANLRETTSPRWRLVYGFLLATAALWLLTDGLETLMNVELLPGRESGTPLDLLWWLPFLALVAAARLRELASPVEASPKDSDPQAEHWGDPLVGYAAAFPLMHFTFSAAGNLDAATGRARELFALLELSILAGLAIAYQKRLLAENRKLQEARLRTLEAEHRAYHDALTGLPNRYLLQDRLELALSRARRSGKRLAVFFIDLDGFKTINDSLGHAVGDRLLVQVAERLARHVRQGDTLARFGGDEFTVLVEAVHHAEDAAKVAHKLQHSLQEAFVVDGREVRVTASIGVTLFPDDGGDAEALLKNSDVAMYRAKEQGRDGVQLFRTEMNLRAEERLALEASLRGALPQGQLVLRYLPFVDLHSRRFVGYEALLRWNHPDKGLLRPPDFLDLAEVTGVSLEACAFTLGEACRRARSWQGAAAGMPVAVNLSPRQFLDRGLIVKVEEALRAAALPPPLLELEISESLAMQNADLTADILAALRRVGVKVSIDDFGTGFSSLLHLKRFALHSLKIDGALVAGMDTDPDRAQVVAAAIHLARTLELQVVAEAVEREEQARMLRALGCYRAQGFLWSPVLSGEELERSLLSPVER